MNMNAKNTCVEEYEGKRWKETLVVWFGKWCSVEYAGLQKEDKGEEQE